VAARQSGQSIADPAQTVNDGAIMESPRPSGLGLIIVIDFGLHSRVKYMHRITDLFEQPQDPEPPHQTVVGVSDDARKEMNSRVTVQLMTKLEDCAEKGFWNFSGSFPLEKEPGDVWRFGIRSLNVRLLGFYENERKDTFVIIDVIKKCGQKLTTAEMKRVNEVARVKRDRDYVWNRQAQGHG